MEEFLTKYLVKLAPEGAERERGFVAAGSLRRVKRALGLPAVDDRDKGA
jgi:hypothetical protein